MDIPPATLQKFKELYKQHFGVELDDQTAQNKAERLIRFVKVVRDARRQRKLKKYGQNGQN